MKITKAVKDTIRSTVYILGVNRHPEYCIQALEEKTPEVVVQRADVGLISETTNNIIRINSTGVNGGGKEYYFRRCRQHRNKREYYRELVEEFCYWNGINNFELLYSLVTDSKRFTRFWEMGIFNDPASNLYRWYQNNDYKLIGLDEIRKSVSDNLLHRFIEYSWGEINVFKQNAYLRNNQFQTDNACKCLAYKAIADLLGYSFVPSSKMIKLKLEQMTYIGLLVDSCKGKSANNYTGDTIRNSISPKLQCKLLELNILDTICGEKDHAPNNYFLVMDEKNKCKEIQVFDNDSYFSFFPLLSTSFKSYSKCAPLVKNKQLMRPYFPLETAQRLQALDGQDFKNALSGLVTNMQLKGILHRVRSINEALNNVTDRKRLITQEEWNQATINKELMSQRGLTYLQLLNNWIL